MAVEKFFPFGLFIVVSLVVQSRAFPQLIDSNRTERSAFADEFEKFIGDHCSSFSSVCPPESLDAIVADNAGKNKILAPLSQDEFIAIASYGAGVYVPVNDALRRHKSDYNIFINMMVEGLEKLPDYYGVTYRYDNIPSEVLSDFQSGKVVTFEAFVSTTMRKDLCDHEIVGLGPFCNYSQFITIHSHHGKDISYWVPHSLEKEVMTDR